MFLVAAVGAVLSLTMGAGLMVFALPLAHAGPIPGALALFITGMAGLGLLGRRRKRMATSLKVMVVAPTTRDALFLTLPDEELPRIVSAGHPARRGPAARHQRRRPGLPCARPPDRRHRDPAAACERRGGRWRWPGGARPAAGGAARANVTARGLPSGRGCDPGSAKPAGAVRRAS